MNDVAFIMEKKLGGPHIPAELCDGKVKRDFSPCSAPLARVLKSIQLPPPRDLVPVDVTYRVAARECGSQCHLEDWTQKLPEGLLDCGRGELQRRPASSLVACVRDALKANRAFQVLIPRWSPDSTTTEVVVYTGTEHSYLWYDSSREGGGGCSATVSKTSCASLAIRLNSEPGAWIECVSPGRTELLCDQINSRVELLGPPLVAKGLHCGGKGTWYTYDDCLPEKPPPDSEKDIVPDWKSPFVVCYPGIRPGGYCRSE